MSTARIRQLNDLLRTTFTGGRVFTTPGIAELTAPVKAKVLERVRTFDRFDGDNDPRGEHDFGAFEMDGDRFFWKIDYYNRDMDGGSEDPSDPQKTTRVLTVMLAAEYWRANSRGAPIETPTLSASHLGATEHHPSKHGCRRGDHRYSLPGGVMPLCPISAEKTRTALFVHALAMRGLLFSDPRAGVSFYASFLGPR